MDTIEKVSTFPSSVLKLHGYYREGLSLSVFSVKVAWSLLGDSGGVVNSLDFCPASLKSFGCFYFRCILSFFTMVHWYTMVGGESEFANFTLPTLKAFLEARRHNVSGNKQGRFQYAHLQSVKVAWTLYGRFQHFCLQCSSGMDTIGNVSAFLS